MIKIYTCQKVVFITMYCKYFTKIIQMITKLDEVLNHILNMS